MDRTTTEGDGLKFTIDPMRRITVHCTDHEQPKTLGMVELDTTKRYVLSLVLDETATDLAFDTASEQLAGVGGELAERGIHGAWVVLSPNARTQGLRVMGADIGMGAIAQQLIAELRAQHAPGRSP